MSDLPINQLIQGDCAQIMASWPGESVDLVVTSPPYGEMRDYNGYHFDFHSIAGQLVRTLKPGGVIVWVEGDQTVDGDESGESFRHALALKDLGLNLYDTMIYEKTGVAAPHPSRYHQSFEYMFVFSKGIPKTIHLIRDRKNNHQRSWGRSSKRLKDGALKDFSKKNYAENGIRFNIWKYHQGYGFSTKDNFAYQHPAIFPEALVKDHIISWSNAGDIVLDPMCGSGTTLKQAKLFNRRWIGIDISQEYLEIARVRLDAVPLSMFAHDSVAEGLTT